jgi:hypothetical protein
MQETVNNANAAISTLFLGHDGEWWDGWVIWSVVFAALAAVAIGVATAGSIVAHKREAAASDRSLEEYKLSTAKEITDARVESDKKIAEANARAAEANQKAEEEKLARVKIEEKLAPRTLTPASQKLIAEGISKFKGTSLDILIYGGGSTDALPLAGMFGDSLTAGGLTVRVWNTISPNRWVVGVLVQTEEGASPEVEERAATIIALLNSVGIGAGTFEHFKSKELPDNLMGDPWNPEKVAPVRMLIGSKP